MTAFEFVSASVLLLTITILVTPLPGKTMTTTDQSHAQILLSNFRTNILKSIETARTCDCPRRGCDHDDAYDTAIAAVIWTPLDGDGSTQTEIDKLRQDLQAEKDQVRALQLLNSTLVQDVAKAQRILCAQAATNWATVHGHGQEHEVLEQEILNSPVVEDFFPGCGCGAKTAAECDAKSRAEAEFFDELERTSK